MSKVNIQIKIEDGRILNNALAGMIEPTLGDLSLALSQLELAKVILLNAIGKASGLKTRTF